MKSGDGKLVVRRMKTDYGERTVKTYCLDLQHCDDYRDCII